MIDCILSKDFDKLILALIPVLSALGTFLIMYADKKKVKTDPLIGLYKTASELTSKDIPFDKIRRHDNLYYPNNKKMRILSITGIIMIILSVVLTIYKVYN